jgi:uncharacterized protein involved in outer membrane biogenesis
MMTPAARRMTRRRRRFVIVMALAVGAIAAAAVAARRAAPGWLRGTIERAVGQALGRELKIAGAFDLSLSLTPTLSASDVRLANAPWGSEPFMVRAGRIRICVDPVSLWSRPVRVRDLVVDDVHVLLETSPQGRGNWAFETKPPTGRPSEPFAQPAFVIERAAVRRLELVVRARPDALPLKAGITALDARLDPATHLMDVRGAGHLGDVPWDVAGRLGPLQSLYGARDVDHSLTGHVGQSTLSLSGRIRDPTTLGGTDVHLKVEGPDIVAALAVLGLKSPLTGAFRVEGRLKPRDGAVDAELRGVLGGVTASARGTLEGLPRPGRIAADVEAAGPDAAVVGSWTGVAGLPPRPFDLAGRLRREGRRLFFDDLKVRVGGTSLEVKGTLGELPRCVGTDLKVAATGRDLSELSALTRLRLPRGAFKVDGRFLRRADALAIEAVEVGVHGASIHAAGTIGEPPGLANLDLTADGTGPDASFLSGIAKVDLPAEPFGIRGRVRRSGRALELDGVAGRLGDSAFDVSGRLVPVRGLVGTDARARVAGGDLSRTASYVGLHGLPAERFDVAGHVRVLAGAYELDGVEARVGGLSGTAEGRLGAPTPLDGTSLACRVHGSALSGLAAWGVPTRLPAEPFVASGRLGIEGGVYRVDGLAVEVGAEGVAVDGVLGALPDAAALDIAVKTSGPDLAALGRFLAAAGATPPAWIPAEPFTAAGRVRRVPTGVEIRDTRAEVGSLKLGASGTVGLGARLLGTDVRFEAEAPDTRVLSEVLGVTLPEGTLHAHGRALRVENDLRLEATEVSIGAARAEARGTFGVPAGLAGSDFEVSVEGPDLAAMLGPPTGLAPLPADPFALSAHLHGSPGRLTSDRFHGRLGRSDLEGSVSVRLGGKPFVEAQLRSKHLDTHRLRGESSRAPDAEEKEAEPAKKTRVEDGRVIPDRLLSLEALRAVDGRLRLAVDEVTVPGVAFRDVEIAGELREGALTLDHVDGTVVTGGRVTGSLSLAPQGDGYRVQAKAQVLGARLVLSKDPESPASAPSLDCDYEVAAVGKSLREMAASADGHVLVVMGSGRVPNGRMSSGVLSALIEALNPFRKSSPYTAFECGVAAAGIDDGKVVVEPIAFRTDKVTVVGDGKLDLGTEDIDLAWTIKPRRGVGVSRSSIANPYIRLGGTLAAPRVEVKPLSAVASTGAAVATLGLTVLFRGIYNRITAEKKVCVDALTEARKREGERAARESAKSRQ